MSLTNRKQVSLLRGLLALGVSLVISGCMPPMGPLSTSSNEGSVVLSFLDARSRTINPTIGLDIATYDITFTCPDQTDVHLYGFSGSTTQPVPLKPGTWTVAASAKNARGNIIGVGSSPVSVTAGHTSTASITILSLSGTGSLTLTADTGALDLSSPSLTGSLIAGGTGRTILVSFPVINGQESAIYSNDSVAAGSYLLQLALKDGTQTLASYVDTVLVVANFPTIGNLSCRPKNGSVIVELADQITRSIPIHMEVPKSTLNAGETMTVTATPAGSVDSYQWYLDGLPISGVTPPNQVTVGTGLDAGYYSLTVVVQNGPVYSSESVGFTVLAPSNDLTFGLTIASCSTSTEAPQPNQPVSISGSSGQVHGKTSTDVMKVVIGFRDGSGRWAGGTPVVISSSVPGVDFQPWTGRDTSISAPSNPGTYYVWVHTVADMGDSAAIADFEAAVPSGDMPGDDRWPRAIVVSAPYSSDGSFESPMVLPAISKGGSLTYTRTVGGGQVGYYRFMVSRGFWDAPDPIYIRLGQLAADADLYAYANGYTEFIAASTNGGWNSEEVIVTPVWGVELELWLQVRCFSPYGTSFFLSVDWP